MNRLDAGDEAAAEQVFQRFAGRLVGRARSRLDAGIRRKEDPEDVVQSVFRSFFVRHAAGNFELVGWESLWGLLIRITMRKCGKRVENLQAACRDIRREVAASESDNTEPKLWDAVTRDPRPDEVVELMDVVESLIRRLGETERQILTLRLQGYSAPEISDAMVHVSEHKVYRLLAQLRKQLG